MDEQIVVKNGLHIVLDIDGTLMDNGLSSDNHDGISCSRFLYFRPGLINFLDYCLKHCASVSIWTAGNEEWMSGFIKALPCRFREAFLFTWHIKRCNVKYQRTGLMTTKLVILKRLNKVWSKKWTKKIGMTRNNTIIIEDTPSNCLNNYGNAVYVSEYNRFKLKAQEDDTLPKLQLYLDHLSAHQTVRNIEKRNWMFQLKIQEEEDKTKREKEKEKAKQDDQTAQTVIYEGEGKGEC